MSRRDRIAAALSTLPGVTGRAFQPQTAHPGDAWARFYQADPVDLSPHYTVFLALPSDARARADRIEELLPLLRPALSRVLHVTSVEEVTLADSGDMPALMCRGK